MTQVGKRTAVIPMRSDKGMWSISTVAPGDAAEVPDGYAIYVHNYLNRPLRQIRRPPFVYDTLMSVAALLRWEDNANQLTRTLAIDASQNLRIKNSTGLGYTASVITGSPSGRLTDYTNFLGQVYMMFDDGAGVPNAASAFDGTTVNTSPFNTPIFARTVTSFIERLFLAYPRVTITNKMSFNNTYLTAAGSWVSDNAFFRLENITSGSIVVARFTPKSATTSWMSAAGNGAIPFAITDSGRSTTEAVVQVAFRNTSALNDAPMQVAVVPYVTWQPLTGNILNQVVRPRTANGFRYRVIAITTGISGAVDPVWPTAVGGTVVDAGVTWINDGAADFAAADVTVTANGLWQTTYLPVSIPKAMLASTTFGVDIRAGNTLVPSLTTFTPVDISLRDGLTDGSALKKNYGVQVTDGDFYYPFYNQESSQTAIQDLDAIVWSEIREPRRILAKNTFTLPEVAGLPTAACQVAGRYIVFKRRGFWVFKRTTDKNIPILPEKPANTEVGCVGPRAWDTYGANGDTLFWIADNGIYQMGDDWQPIEIGGDAMREEIIAHGANWVEPLPSLAGRPTSPYQTPFLVVEHANKEVWVYTQRGKLYVYHIPSKYWSVVDVSSGAEVQTMLFDYSGNRLLVAWGGAGVTRLMETSTTKDTLAETTPLPITCDVTFKPLELYAPRYEAYLEEVGVFHLATASQTGQTITPSYSYDRGVTFTTPTGYPATVNLNSPRCRLPIGAMGPSVTVKISTTGFGGAANWSLSKADATLQVKRGELPWANATTV